MISMNNFLLFFLNITNKCCNIFRSKVKNTIAVQSWSADNTHIRFINISGEQIVLKDIKCQYNCTVRDFFSGFIVNANDEFNIYLNNLNSKKQCISFIIKCSVGNNNDRYCLVRKKKNCWIVQ